MLASDIITEIIDDMGYDSTDATTIEVYRKHLNRALKDVVNRSRCIQKTQFHAAVADQFEYALPSDFLRVDVAKWQDDPPLQKASLSSIHAGRWFAKTSDRPSWYDVWGNARKQRATGTATSGSSTTLVDTTVADFGAITDPVLVDDLVLNTPDDSEATVTSISGSTVTFSGGLAGGSDNIFAASDAYIIQSAGAPLKVLVIHPAVASADATGVESLAVLYAAKHREITAANLTSGNDDLELDEELEAALIHRVEYWAWGAGTPQRQQALIDYRTEYRNVIPRVNKRIRENISFWHRNSIIFKNNITGTNRVFTRNSVVI
jgi:hypothetical protein|tara:strand:+ start:1721 stop:2680 length:960 start_codon:yes stop_codon:yes gene_type:complete